MEIVLVDSENDGKGESLDTIKAPIGALENLDLAMWRYVEIRKTISSYIGKRGRIKLISDLEERTSNPLWAVANVRACPPVGVFSLNRFEID